MVGTVVITVAADHVADINHIASTFGKFKTVSVVSLKPMVLEV
jgi:hypothetical protein